MPSRAFAAKKKAKKGPVKKMSPATSRKDRIIKYRLYEQAGVKYYCIVDPETNSADIFTLRKEKYGKTGAFKDGKIIFHLGPCGIEFDFSSVFG
jgi:Uma2 family endonuclease